MTGFYVMATLALDELNMDLEVILSKTQFLLK